MKSREGGHAERGEAGPGQGREADRVRAAGDSREPVGTGGPVGFQGRRGPAGERWELDWASWGAQGGGQQKAGLEGSREGKGARQGGGEGGGLGAAG